MNKASRLAAAAFNSQANPFQVKASLFHSTPVLERKRRYNWHNAHANSYWSSPKKFNKHAKRSRRHMSRNVNAFAEHLLQGWGSVHHEYKQPSSRQRSWFRPNFTGGGSKKGKSKAGHRTHEFCDSDDEIEFESIFRSTFGGGKQYTSYSFFVDDDEPEFRSSSGHSSYHRKYSGRRYQSDDEEYEEYEWSSHSGEPVRNSSSDRLALGLSACGPLNVEDVKNAYRACALKWHPDRHQSSSKVAAEEKFKACSAAYQSLCDKLTVS